MTAIDAYGQTASTRLTIQGTQTVKAAFDLTFEVSPSFAPEYARTSFHDRTSLLYAELAIRNAGQYPTGSPLYVGIRNISDPTVTVRNVAGVNRDGIPYYDFSPHVSGNSLVPEETTGFVDAVFYNPNRVPFTYELVFLVKLNEPPAFTTVPIVETHPGWDYRYDAHATDPDGDPRTYSLLSGPLAMTVDSATGQVTWLPAEADRGVHSVTLRAEDGRGGAAEQRYLLSVRKTPPNRPPYFMSVPVTEARLSANGHNPYRYNAEAIDPDLAPIQYSLLQAPEGMQTDSATGLVTWNPTAAQLGLHSVIIEATDDRNGVAQQTFSLRAKADPSNRLPVFVSIPPSALAIREDQTVEAFRYQAVAIDPDDDPLTYVLVNGPDEMIIDAATGLLTWAVPSDLLERNAVRIFDGNFDPIRWSRASYYRGQTGATSVERYSTGGNPGAYQSVTTTVPAASATGGNATYGVHRYTPVTIDSADLGAVHSISYSEDIRMLSGRA